MPAFISVDLQSRISNAEPASQLSVALNHAFHFSKIVPVSD